MLMFTARESQYLKLFCQGKTVQEISEAMGIDKRTCAVHKVHIKGKVKKDSGSKPKNDVQLYQWAAVNPKHWHNAII